jgi:hypothetical protein
MTSAKDLLKGFAIDDSDDEDASQGVQRRSTVPQRPDATPRSSMLAFARTPDTPDATGLTRRDRATATSESSKSASEQRPTHLPSAAAAAAVRERSSASAAAAPFTVPPPSVSQRSSASYQRAPLTPLEQVMFVLFVALGLYLLFAWVSWSFAVATGSDTGHPFGGTRFVVRANDAWPAPIAAVLRFVTGTTPVDDSVILA